MVLGLKSDAWSNYRQVSRKHSNALPTRALTLHTRSLFGLSDNDRERRACEQARAGLPSRKPHQARSIARRAQERTGVQACTKNEEEG